MMFTQKCYVCKQLFDEGDGLVVFPSFICNNCLCMKAHTKVMPYIRKGIGQRIADWFIRLQGKFIRGDKREK